MQKIKYISCIYYTILFFCSKGDSTHYLIMRIHNKSELQQIAINHSADIDYKNFMKIYRKCTSEPYSFLTIDTALPANNSLRFLKNLLSSL